MSEQPEIFPGGTVAVNVCCCWVAKWVSEGLYVYS